MKKFANIAPVLFFLAVLRLAEIVVASFTKNSKLLERLVRQLSFSIRLLNFQLAFRNAGEKENGSGNYFL